MFKILNDKLLKLKSFDDIAYTIGVGLKVKIAQETIIKAQMEITKKIPELNTTDISEKEEKFIIRTGDIKEVFKQSYVGLYNYNALQIGWGSLAKIDFEEFFKTIFNIGKEYFWVSPNLIELVDFQLLLVSRWEGNHFKAITETFHKKTPLYSLFKTDRLVNNQILLSGLLDKSRVCSIRVSSDVANQEVVDNKYKNDRLKISIGVGHLYNIPLDKELYDIFKENCDFSINYIIGECMPNIIIPLDKEVSILSKK